MGKRTRLACLLLHILFSAVHPATPCAYPRGTAGVGPEECTDKQYWSLKNTVGTCNDCTAPCGDNRNMIEINPCTKISNRKCQCKAGYYCSSPVRQTCRRTCEPCESGFTNTSNLYRSCEKYTDCAGLGMLVIKEGSRTSDRVCGYPVTTRDTQMFSPFETREESPSEGSPSEGSRSDESPSEGSPAEGCLSDESPSEGSPAEKSPSEEPPSSQSAKVAWTTEGKEGLVQLSQPFTKTTWIFLCLILLLLIFCLVPYLCLKCKGKAIKNKLELAGLVSGRYPRFPTARPNPKVETPEPGNHVTDTIQELVQDRGSFPGKNQRVTMEHVGKADSINNTVGSIFIYSPGMVILGSNSNEKKEEAETSVEDGSGGEDTRLMSVPQQESSSETDFIRFATQEELGKELSIPIPATSK